VSEDSGRAAWLVQARSCLRDADPVLARLIDGRPDFDPRAWLAQLPPMDLFGALLFQVTGQQLSVPATRRTLARIQALFGGRLPAPAELLAADPGQLRQAGLSWRKVATLRDLAERMADGRLNQEVLSALPDDELMTELTAIPGIGPWTVQGALLIALHREDVVLPGDLALRKAIQAAYRLGHCPASRRSWPSPTNGGPTAAWPPATCSPPPSSQPGRRRSPRGKRSAVPAPAHSGADAPAGGTDDALAGMFRLALQAAPAGARVVRQLPSAPCSAAAGSPGGPLRGPCLDRGPAVLGSWRRDTAIGRVLRAAGHRGADCPGSGRDHQHA